MTKHVVHSCISLHNGSFVEGIITAAYKHLTRLCNTAKLSATELGHNTPTKGIRTLGVTSITWLH